MEIYGKDIKKIEKPIVAAIGFFDGVHRGHQFLIEQVKEEAKRRGLESAILTFKEHPRKVLDAELLPLLLTGYEEKIDLLSKTGIDICIPLSFTYELSQMSAKEFMQDILKNELNVDTLIIGYDHRFGHDRKDGFAEYVKYGKELGISVFQAKELDTGEYISSSLIRKKLLAGDVDQAGCLLGYNYNLIGTVIDGHRLGRTIGFPTANIALDEPFKVLPKPGVYAAYAYLGEEKLKGMLYIGHRPTMHSDNFISIEINLFDFDRDIYKERISIELVQFIRRDVKFASLDILKRQMSADGERAREILQ